MVSSSETSPSKMMSLSLERVPDSFSAGAFQDEVSVVGYPTGGDGVSVTEGVVCPGGASRRGTRASCSWNGGLRRERSGGNEWSR